MSRYVFLGHIHPHMNKTS